MVFFERIFFLVLEFCCSVFWFLFFFKFSTEVFIHFIVFLTVCCTSSFQISLAVFLFFFSRMLLLIIFL